MCFIPDPRYMVIAVLLTVGRVCVAMWGIQANYVSAHACFLLVLVSAATGDRQLQRSLSNFTIS